MKTLKLAEGLTLPIDIVTQTMAILAKRRAGKSYTMRRLVEQLVKARQQVVLIDPKGDQWGIRSAADGKSPGLPLVILGGERADVPLEVGAGEVVAKLVVEERVSAVLDLSLFRKREVGTFMEVFLETLYRLKAREKFRTPMMLVVDEADAIAPQKPMPGEERMLGAIEDIVRRGGQRGIGCVVVTQRSAVLNKNVLTQAQILVALRTIAPQDLKAMKEWIDVHGDEGERRILMESLPSLPVGDAWFWSPGWPTADGIFQRVHVLPLETFDSGATPAPGQKRVEPKTVADVDLDALKRQMSATIEKAKADDPRELRVQIATLNAEIAKLRKSSMSAPAQTTAPKVVEKPVLKDAQLARVEQLVTRVEKAIERASQLVTAPVGTLRASLGEITSALQSIRQPALPLAPARPVAAPPREPAPTPRQERSPQPSRAAAVPGGSTVKLKKGARDILGALASRYPQTMTWSQLALLCGIKSRGSTMSSYMSNLRQPGFITESGDHIGITEAGRAFFGAYVPSMQTKAEIFATWAARLKRGARAILDDLDHAYPNWRTKEELSADVLGIDAGGSTLSSYLSNLRTAGLIEEDDDGRVRRHSDLGD